MRPGNHELYVVDRQGNRIAPLPETQVEEAVWDLGLGEGKMTITHSPRAAYASAIHLNKTEIQLWIDGELEWWGVPRQREGNSRQLRITCEDLFSYFHYRFVLEEDLVYEDQEQQSIAAALVTYAQSAAQGVNPNLYIAIAGFAGSGVLRSRTYTSDRKGAIIEGLADFATLEDGFDQSIEVFGNGSRYWTPHFPQKGSLKDVALEYGRSVVDYSYREDGTKMATKIDATGGTAQVDVWDPFQGRTKQNYIHEDAAASTEYGVHIAVLPSGAKSDMAWLESRAKRAVALRKKPLVLTGVTCRQGGDYPQLLGNLVVGDSAPVRIDDGSIQVNGIYRIKTVTWLPRGNLVKYDFTSEVA